jgi:CPA2 family monovalent cation:H+ antiporter-2
LAVAVVGLVALKAAIFTLLARAFGVSWRPALESGLLLGPGGEFAFVSIGLAVSAQLVSEPIGSFTLAAVAITMALTPLLAIGARRLLPAPATAPVVDPDLMVHVLGGEQHAIVVGFGRVGKVVCSLFGQHGVKFIAVDNDAVGVARDRRHGHPVYFGDASDVNFLKASGLAQATGVIITINSHRVIDAIVERVRAARPDVVIISRARDEKHASHLYEVGATDAVPETIEASLQLSEAALVSLGIPTGPVIASIHEKRDEFRHALQSAAKQAGLSETRALKAKRSV